MKNSLILILSLICLIVFVNCENTPYCANQKKLIQSDEALPIIPINFNFTKQAIANQIAEHFEDMDSLCQYSPYFYIPFDFKNQTIQDNSNGLLVPVKAIHYCYQSSWSHLSGRYDLWITSYGEDQLFMLGNTHSRTELDALIDNWYFGTPEETERTLKETRFKIDFRNQEEAQDSVVATMMSLLDAYYAVAEKVAVQTYQQSVCALKPDELKALRAKMPLEIILRLQGPAPPPPPSME